MHIITGFVPRSHSQMAYYSTVSELEMKSGNETVVPHDV